MSVKIKWSLNGIYHDLYDKAKKIIKQDACMKFCDALKHHILGDGCICHWSLGWIMQVREDMIGEHGKLPDNVTLCLNAFASKSFASPEWQYSNTEQEALGILVGLQRCHLHCFGQEGIYNNRL